MTRMKTAVFCAMRGFALARSRLDVMGAFVDAGWRVVALTEADRTAQDLRDAGVEVVDVPFFTRGRRPLAWPFLARRLKGELTDLRPDFLHTYNALPIILGGLAGAGSAIPVRVATVTGLGRGYGRGGAARRLTLAGYGRGLRGVDWTVFQNEADREILTERQPQLAARSSVIVGSGADTDRFLPSTAPPEERPRVLMVSRLLWQKGVREFEKLARVTAASCPEVRFQLAGELVPDDPDAVPAEWIADRQAEGVWEFLGYREDLEDVLPGAAVVVHPTRYREGVPRIVLEAGACAVPVVAFRGPGTDDVIRDGETGHLVAPGDETALAAKVHDLVRYPGDRQRMGAAAAEHIRRNHTLADVTRRYLDLYRSLGVDLP